jgi:hypothetical protein
MLNENNLPELVHWHWRMATDHGAITDNVGGGGTVWIAYDLETGEIGRGDNIRLRDRQKLLFQHPVTNRRMVGTRFPFGEEVRSLAMQAHANLKGVLVIGWDIAMTDKGPVIVEMNFPPGVLSIMQIAWDGFENCRFGAIMGWRTRRWIAEHIEIQSKRRIAAHLVPD